MSRIAAIAALALATTTAATGAPASAADLCTYHGLRVDARVCIYRDPGRVHVCAYALTPAGEFFLAGVRVYTSPPSVGVGC
jgi:hypothetical protein